MPFRQLNARKAKYGFEGRVTPTNIITVGKVVDIARKLDPDVVIAMKAQGDVCTLTIHSNEPKVEAMVNAYSKV